MVEIPKESFENRPSVEDIDDSKYKCGICPYASEYSPWERPCGKCAIAVIAESLESIAKLMSAESTPHT